MSLPNMWNRVKGGRASSCRRQHASARRLVLETLEERTLLSYSFTLIADSSGLYSDISRFTPSINSAGAIAFEANLKAGGEAILAGSGGDLTTIAASGDVIG